MKSYSYVVIIANESTIYFPVLEFVDSNEVLGDKSLNNLC